MAREGESMSDTEKLEEIRNAMADFRKALLDREDWPIAANKFIETCEDLLDADSVAGELAAWSEASDADLESLVEPQLGPDSEH